jgi:hypothetical protein
MQSGDSHHPQQASGLKHLDSKPGDRFEISLMPGGRLEVKAAPSDGIESIFGVLSGKTRKLATIDEIGAVAAAGLSAFIQG